MKTCYGDLSATHWLVVNRRWVYCFLIKSWLMSYVPQARPFLFRLLLVSNTWKHRKWSLLLNRKVWLMRLTPTRFHLTARSLIVNMLEFAPPSLSIGGVFIISLLQCAKCLHTLVSWFSICGFWDTLTFSSSWAVSYHVIASPWQQSRWFPWTSYWRRCVWRGWWWGGGVWHRGWSFFMIRFESSW